jgi:predicted RNA binding protein YcfA (HicA-like mRNA interferase family)
VAALPVVSGREAVRAFGKVGYETDRQRGSHIIRGPRTAGKIALMKRIETHAMTRRGGT